MNHFFQQQANYQIPPQLQHPFHHDRNAKPMFAMLPPPPLPLSTIPPPPFDRDISPPRKRTRTSPEQLAVLEKAFSSNPSPNNRVREQLSHQLGMPERSIQIWFQNRRAKVKNQAKRSAQLHDSAPYIQQQYAASAAAAACQSAAFQQQQDKIDPNLYYYYYYYYYHQQQQHGQSLSAVTDHASFPPPPPPQTATNASNTPDLTLSASTSSSSSITSDNHQSYHRRQYQHNRSASVSSLSTERTRAHSVGHYPYYRNSAPHERHSSLGPPPTASTSNPINPSYTTSSSNVPAASTAPSDSIHSHQLVLNSTSNSAILYNASTIIEEPYHIASSSTSGQQKFNLTAQALQIGSWKRVSDLSCHMDLSTRTMSWCIDDEQQSFRIDINLNLIQFIRMHSESMTNTHKLEFFLSSPDQVQFFMTSTMEGNAWVQCHDFTQDRQASLENVHVLEGYSLLQAEFMEILMQAPDLQALVIQEDEEQHQQILQNDTVASMYHHGSFLNNNSSHSLLLDDMPTTDDGMTSNLLLLQGLNLP
ncbi:hypothetical protein [Parasitella parasitica]|uniref:Homeobox domain-containing protein n=1 Tax=Parasitella parasitica TaxID=35722 RepID=A0A0B7NTH8_9FUNG|nr:hypothetical protein [Parasitella parasitica]